jgi:hypothetical protein
MLRDVTTTWSLLFWLGQAGVLLVLISLLAIHARQFRKHCIGTVTPQKLFQGKVVSGLPTKAICIRFITEAVSITKDCGIYDHFCNMAIALQRRECQLVQWRPVVHWNDQIENILPHRYVVPGVIASLAFNDAVLWRVECQLISNQVHIGTRRPSDIIDLDMNDALIQVRNGIFSSENRFIRINHYFPLPFRISHVGRGCAINSECRSRTYEQSQERQSRGKPSQFIPYLSKNTELLGMFLLVGACFIGLFGFVLIRDFYDNSARHNVEMYIGLILICLSIWFICHGFETIWPHPPVLE